MCDVGWGGQNFQVPFLHMARFAEMPRGKSAKLCLGISIEFFATSGLGREGLNPEPETHIPDPECYAHSAATP